MRTGKADFGYDGNNGTLVVFPLETGSFADMVRKTSDNLPTMWVFKDTQSWMDDHMNKVFDYMTRGVVSGSFQDGRNLIDELKKLGYIVEYTGVFVPFSNGKHEVYLRAYPKDDSQRIETYTERELRMARIDLPELKFRLGK
ncbi:MAG: hypothetical protein V1848_02120 [Candidatus Magasanikbacteria bacterium]